MVNLLGDACGPGCTLIRLQALGPGRYPLPSLSQIPDRKKTEVKQDDNLNMFAELIPNTNRRAPHLFKTPYYS